jgi:DNA-binding MarR family transcriptional regulator
MSDDKEPLRAWLDLLSATNAIKKGVDARLRLRFGVSISRFDVLAALAQAGDAGLTAGALTSRLRVTEGNTTQVTAPLIEGGLVRRLSSPQDGRVAILTLTKKGERLFAQMAAENRQWVADAFAALSPAQIASLRGLLGALQPPSSALKEKSP